MGGSTSNIDWLNHNKVSSHVDDIDTVLSHLQLYGEHWGQSSNRVTPTPLYCLYLGLHFVMPSSYEKKVFGDALLWWKMDQQ